MEFIEEYIKVKILESFRTLGIEGTIEVIENISNPVMRFKLRNLVTRLIKREV